MPKKHGAGKCGAADCCNTRPCCSDVWDSVRADYSTVTLTLNGTTGPSAPSDPMVDSGAIIESAGSPPFVFYQCGIGFTINEPYDTPPITPPYRFGYDPPEIGGTTLFYSRGFLNLAVDNCIPSQALSIEARLHYNWWPGSSVVSALTSAGYTLDATYSDALSRDRYYQTSGFFTDEVLYRPANHACYLTTKYQRTLTNLADMITVLPNPLTLVPAFNPHPMSLVVDFS